MADDMWAEPTPLDDEDETTFWREQRAVVDEYREQNDRRQWFADTREQANTVVCRDCRRAPGEVCILVGSNPPEPLTKFPAHVRRINDARRRYQ